MIDFFIIYNLLYYYLHLSSPFMKSFLQFARKTKIYMILPFLYIYICIGIEEISIDFYNYKYFLLFKLTYIFCFE